MIILSIRVDSYAQRRHCEIDQGPKRSDFIICFLSNFLPRKKVRYQERFWSGLQSVFHIFTQWKNKLLIGSIFFYISRFLFWQQKQGFIELPAINFLFKDTKLNVCVNKYYRLIFIRFLLCGIYLPGVLLTYRGEVNILHHNSQGNGMEESFRVTGLNV